MDICANEKLRKTDVQVSALAPTDDSEDETSTKSCKCPKARVDAKADGTKGNADQKDKGIPAIYAGPEEFEDDKQHAFERTLAAATLASLCSAWATTTSTACASRIILRSVLRARMSIEALGSVHGSAFQESAKVFALV